MHQSLLNIIRLCEFFNHPEKAYPTIHIAGTNGKGSVATKIARVLQNEGYVTGLYTSPHISSFRERIQINGELIPVKELVHIFTSIPLNLPAPFFEIATLLAFIHFQQKKVDVAVMETGLGGRLDATNVIQPMISVITSIGFDHTEILGTTLDEIAGEKAGIIKKGVPLIIGPDVDHKFMKKRADLLEAPLYQSLLQDEDYDIENQGIARLALEIIKSYLPISEKFFQEGLKAKPPCRFERHMREKEVVLDVAHNPHGFNRLIKKLQATYPNHDYRFVVGFSKGKDINECIKLIRQNSHKIHLVSSSHPHLATLQEMQINDAIKEETISQGVQNALRAYNQKPEVIIVAGSFFIMNEARKALGLQDSEDPIFFKRNN